MVELSAKQTPLTQKGDPAMRTSTVTLLAPVLPALGTLAHAAKKTRRCRKMLRMYRPEAAPADLSAEQLSALTTLVSEGHTVKVYAMGSIYTLALTDDGALDWSNVRPSGRYRATLVTEVHC